MPLRTALLAGRLPRLLLRPGFRPAPGTEAGAPATAVRGRGLAGDADGEEAEAGAEEAAAPAAEEAEAGAEAPAPAALREVLGRVKGAARARFDETVEVALNLGIDPKRTDHTVRGAVALPHGTGRRVRVAMFARDEAAAAARACGADVVGAEDLVQRIKEGALDFDRAIATPDMMKELGPIARILGPKGLMPNPKLGTVSADVEGAVAAVKKGQVAFRSEKGAIVHAGVGKVSFADGDLEENVGALVAAVLAMRPKGLKGAGAANFLLRGSVSSTMGHGHPVTVDSLVEAAAAQTAEE